MMNNLKVIRMIRIMNINNSIHITGHTDTDICASVSTILYTTVNALILYDTECFEFIDDKENDFVNMKLIKNDKIIDMLFKNMIDLFEDLQSQFPNNIQIVKSL